MTELEKVIPQREHPILTERKARFQAKKLDLDEFKIQRELEALRKEEEAKENQLEGGGREAKVRTIIQQIKVEIYPASMMKAIPAKLILILYGRIENTLSKLPVLDIPHDELLLVGKTVIHRFKSDCRLQ